LFPTRWFFTPIFAKSAIGMCVYIARMYSAGCAGTFQTARVRVHQCTRARESAPFVRARADAWVRATRERCAGRLFRYCCYCWGNNRPSIGRLGTMYLFRCGQRCSIDQDPPFASCRKNTAKTGDRSSLVSRCASRNFLHTKFS